MKKYFIFLFFIFSFHSVLKAEPIHDLANLFPELTELKIIDDWEKERKIEIRHHRSQHQNGHIKLEDAFYEKLSILAPQIEILIFTDNGSFNSSRIAAFDFSKCIKLKHLDLSDNFLSEAPDLSMCTQLEHLDLHYNMLKSFPQIAASAPLKHLYLSYNFFESIPDLSSYLTLERLNLGYNMLESFPQIAASAPLKHLYLHENYLREVPDLLTWPTLKRIILSRNYLVKIPRVPETYEYYDIQEQFFDLENFAGLFREEWRSRIIENWGKKTLNLSGYGPLPQNFWYALSGMIKRQKFKKEGEYCHDDKYASPAIKQIIDLNLSGCSLTLLPIDLFKNAYFLEVLNIQNNPNLLRFPKITDAEIDTLTEQHPTKFYIDEAHIALPGADFLTRIPFENIFTCPPTPEDTLNPELGTHFDINTFAGLFREQWRAQIISDWDEKTLNLHNYGPLPRFFWKALTQPLSNRDSIDPGNTPAFSHINILNLDGCNLIMLPPILLENVTRLKILNIQNNPALSRFAHIKDEKTFADMPNGKTKFYIDRPHIALPGADFLTLAPLHTIYAQPPFFEDQ